MSRMQTRREEFVNSLTHGAGLVLSAIGAAVMIAWAAWSGSVWNVVSCSIYGASMVFMFTASTVYHGVRQETRKRIWKQLDHVAIFLLIAGSYTPFTLVLMRGNWGWTLFSAIWGCAALGIIFKLLSPNRYNKLVVAFYVGMGWMAVLAIKPMLESVPLPGMLWILAGGLFYTAGVYFYVKDRKHYYHAVWHLFVLAGCFCHYIAVLFHVVPLA